jgi:hypothetical protein
METRKNFPKSIVEETLSENNYQCQKCSKSLKYGYHVHHKDGDSSNIEKENCMVLCSSCHGGEQFNTLQLQKKETIGQLDDLIGKATRGEIAGALMDKAVDAIKLKLSLAGQVADIGSLELPVEKQMEAYEQIAQAKMRSFEDGYLAGLTKQIEISDNLKSAIEKMKKK